MTARRARIIGVWLAFVALAAAIAANAHYIADLSAFLPARPTATQRLLIDQLRSGPASRLILAALEGGDAKARAAICIEMAKRLKADRQFSSINDGETDAADRDREFLFEHRYALSDAVTPERFKTAGLKSALESTIADLASPEGLFIKSLVPHDPTGETLKVIDQLSRTPAPPTREGVWGSADGERTLLVAQTAAEGSDTDAQERALTAIRAAFDASKAGSVRLRLSGPGAFAVSARAKIQHAVIRLSIASSILVAAILLAVYRSPTALVLGLLPVATGALAGIAAVALGFGAVHGITLGFGITLIGESVDYSIYFFIQSGERRLWSTIGLGMLTSVVGFASLLPSGFPGLAQLGAYSISGLIAAAAVTRFVLPELVPPGMAIRNLAPLGARIGRALEPVRRLGGPVIWMGALVCAAAAIGVLMAARSHLWSHELSSLSPIPAEMLNYDAKLRGDLGAANVLDLIVVSGDSLESVLEGAERTARVLEPLIAEKIIGGFDNPATYLPSLATQSTRLASLPPPAPLRAALDEALAGLPLDRAQLEPFLNDVEAARHQAPITPKDLEGTSLAAGFNALVLHQGDRWNALMPLHAPDPAAPDIDAARVLAALAAGAPSARFLDMKHESDALYGDYLHQAMRMSLAGLAVIAALLAIVLRSATRVARVLAPLILAVLAVAAGLVLLGIELTILHLVGMLLIVAVGSNYALFFDRRADDGRTAPLTLASLVIANLCTVIGFGLLVFSGVPVLEALGGTVAPGTLLALLFAAVLAPSDA